MAAHEMIVAGEGGDGRDSPTRPGCHSKEPLMRHAFTDGGDSSQGACRGLPPEMRAFRPSASLLLLLLLPLPLVVEDAPELARQA
jgi:hypothetical protein